MTWNRIYTQTGVVDTVDATLTQVSTDAIILPDNYARTGIDVAIVPITSGGVPTTGVDRGAFTVKVYMALPDASGTVYYTGTTPVDVDGYAHAQEVELPRGVRVGVAVSNAVLPATATGYRILVRDRA